MRDLFILCLLLIVASCSSNRLFVPESVMGPYPSAGSVVDQGDISELLHFQALRTEEDCHMAALEAHANLDNFFGKMLSHKELEKIKPLFTEVLIKAGANILWYKRKFSRPRPYESTKEIKPCVELEMTAAYPSGHATLSRIYARLLGTLYPERRKQFLERANQIALHRVLAGVHHPSDVEAGKKLGDAIAEDFLADYDFMKRFSALIPTH